MKHPRNLPLLENFQPHRSTAASLRAAQARVLRPAETLGSGAKTASWFCSLIAAGIMLETLFFKFTAAPESVYIFTKMGTEPWMRWVQGIWELMASLALLTPRLKAMGGVLTTGAMLAAILSHMTWLGFVVQGDHGLLFGMAIVTLSCGLTVLMLHRRELHFLTPLSSY